MITQYRTTHDFKVVIVTKLFRDLSPTFLTYIPTLTCAFEGANGLKKDFKLTRFAFDVLQKFETVPHE